MSTNAMHVAKTGLNAQQVRMQVIANTYRTSIQQVLKETELTLRHFCIKLLEIVVTKLLLKQT